MGILHIVEAWHPYLIGRCFQIKTSHHSLKYHLEKRLSSLEQHKWATKMLGYDYEIIFIKRRENMGGNALSRQFEEEGSLFSLSLLVPGWRRIKNE